MPVITRTRPFSVTAIGAEPYCDLRATLESEKVPRPIPGGPEALLGTLIHEALRLHGNDGANDVVSYLRAALSDARGIAPSAATVSGTVRLRDAISATRVSARLRLARASAERAPRANPYRQPNSPGAARGSAAHGTLREQYLRSDRLQLVGQVDSLTLGEICKIIDYKTGNILDPSGEVRAHYRNQLLLYGLLAGDCGYGSKFVLALVGSDAERSFDFDRSDCSALETRLSNATTLAPVGRAVDFSSLARVGPACLYCNFRPLCDAYRDAAPKRWVAADLDHTLPPDIWGTLVEIRADAMGAEYAAVRIVDAADRLVSVTGIPRRHLPNSCSRYEQIAVFGAVAHRSGPLHPLNFAVAVPGNAVASRHAAVIKCSPD